MQSEEEAFLEAVLAAPSDPLVRLVFADWLDERDDPRGGYLRAEVDWAGPRIAERESAVEKLATGLDPVWVARVTRPPLGVCTKGILFADSNPDRPRPKATSADLDWIETRFGFTLPPDYRAFLLNYNGGTPTPDTFAHAEVERRFGIELPEGYSGQVGKDGGMCGIVVGFMAIHGTDEPDVGGLERDWNLDLVNVFQILDHYRNSGDPAYDLYRWCEHPRNDLIWIGYSVANGEHEVWCLGIRGDSWGKVYHVPSDDGHYCMCDECVLIAPTFAAFLSLFEPEDIHLPK